MPGRRRALGAFSILIVLASCSSTSGPGAASAPSTSAPAIVPISVPGSAPLPTTLRASSRPSMCSADRPANFAQRGVAGASLYISLVGIAPVVVEVCAYGRAGALAAGVAFGGVAARTVVDALNTVAGIDPISGPRCEPAPDAPVVVAVSDGLRLEQVSASLTGCRSVSNGLLSGAGTSSSSSVVRRSLALAALCSRHFEHSPSCIAGAL